MLTIPYKADKMKNQQQKTKMKNEALHKHTHIHTIPETHRGKKTKNKRRFYGFPHIKTLLYLPSVYSNRLYLFNVLHLLTWFLF